MCYQYIDMKHQIEGLPVLSAVSTDGLPGGTKISDPVGSLASKRDKLLSKIKAIEDASGLLGDIGPGVLKGVTTIGVSYEWLRQNQFIFCGRRQYYDARQMFFWYLDKKI